MAGDEGNLVTKFAINVNPWVALSGLKSAGGVVSHPERYPISRLWRSSGTRSQYRTDEPVPMGYRRATTLPLPSVFGLQTVVPSFILC